jgi:hypothetical protein
MNTLRSWHALRLSIDDFPWKPTYHLETNLSKQQSSNTLYIMIDSVLCVNKMPGLIISDDSTAEELEPMALAIYGTIGLPITIRSNNHNGVRVENSKVVDYNYTGEYLAGTGLKYRKYRPRFRWKRAV